MISSMLTSRFSFPDGGKSRSDGQRYKTFLIRQLPNWGQMLQTFYYSNL
jgi:hypothetical protein